MKAARLAEYGAFLTIENVPDPRIAGPHDVIVRVGGAGLCRTDLHIVDGMLRGYFDVSLPYTLGHETAGWVEETGPAVRSIRAGDAVILHPEVTCGLCVACRDGRDMYCGDSRSPGFNSDGGFAEFVLVNERSVVRLNEAQEPLAVAPLADAGLAAYRAVKRAVRVLGPGTRAVVIGAGGLGHIAIQLLHALCPAEILVVDTSPMGLALASHCGADRVLEGGAGAVDAVQAATGGHGVDVVLDFVGDSDTPAQACRMLRKGGSYHIVGYGGTFAIPTAEMVGLELTVSGSMVGSYTELVELMYLSASGRVRLETEEFALADIGKAVDALQSGRVRGRAVLRP